jgi:two-component system, sensor histidine kinase and response regulator
MQPSRLQAFSHMNVLIVDDDPICAFLTGEYMQALGFTVEVAADGKAALAHMEADLPDLVLCDQCMPELSGLDVLEIVRGRGPEWQAVAFVFLSGLTEPADPEAMRSLRPDGYICKPIKNGDFDAELAAILEQR